MTVLGGVSPKFKGEDDLSTAVEDFHVAYTQYMTAYNTYIQYLLDEKELIRSHDAEALVTVRQTSALAVEKVTQDRINLRTEWAALKKTWRIFNRGGSL